MLKFIITLLLATQLLFAGEITIAVAANVSYALDELEAEFAKTNPNTKIRVIVGSSGKLVAQIKNGAPYGLFMSANMRYPQSLYSDGIATTKPTVYAQGALAYLSLKKQDFSKGIALLQDKNITTIAIANPQASPYGKAAVDAMHKAKLYDAIKSKLLYAESISQTVTYALRAADIGIIAKSSLYSPKMSRFQENIDWKTLNPKLYKPINQGIVLLKYAKNSQEYRAFYDFILSQRAKRIFQKYGYRVKGVKECHNSM